MTPPRHPADDDLKSYIDSVPPSSGMASAHDRLAAKLDTPTGIHDLRELQHQVQRQAIEIAQGRIDTERKRADRAEGMLRWLSGIVAGVLVIVIAAIIVGKVLRQ